ncbi:hypothetical protein EDC94DRAFT_510012, partial [Helicostylum pulchrum]
KAKNIWYKLMHNKINTRVVTHRLIPDTVQSPLCPFCTTESFQHPEHTFINCQRIWQIWKISFQYLFPRQLQLHLLSAKQVSSILYTFRFPKFFESNLPPAFLFGSILEAIWIHYWRFVFDEIPFIPNQVVCTAIKIYHQYTDQTNLDSPTLIP